MAALTLRASPFEMGLLGVAQFLPGPLFGLLAGVWLDRTHRLPVVVGSQLVNMAALATIPAAALAHVVPAVTFQFVNSRRGLAASLAMAISAAVGKSSSPTWYVW